MQNEEMALDVIVGFAAGLMATKITEYAQQALWQLTPESVRQQEQRVRPGPPYRLAARKTLGALGIRREADELSEAGMMFHYASGVAWGSVYCLMRRATGMRWLGAGTATGASMSLILDEAVTPALGFSAPNRAYPTATHARGVLGHLVYGFALAASAEAIYRLLEGTDRPDARTEASYG